MMRWIFMIVVSFAAMKIYGSSAAYPNDQPAKGWDWPPGMSQLVNITNRVGGFFVNAEDIFFFSGIVSNFNAFLAEYSTIEPVVKHRLILNEGVGDAKPPWGKTSTPCDWQLYGCPQDWYELGRFGREATNSEELLQKLRPYIVPGESRVNSNGAVEVIKQPKNLVWTNYILEVHFWIGGKIALDELTIPSNVELAGSCLKNFESIQPGMTRAEVEARLIEDGGLQGVSPVRFVDTNCPGFKINVEFEFKKNADDENRAIQGKDDKVTKVSKPYLERPFTD